jgi:putative transposase
MADQTSLQRMRHAVFNLHVHLVLVPKYRRKCITARVFEVLKAAWLETCARMGCTLDETNWEPDHVHLLLSYPPKVPLSALVHALKGYSARKVRAMYLPEVRKVLRGPAFWSPS